MIAENYIQDLITMNKWPDLYFLQAHLNLKSILVRSLGVYFLVRQALKLGPNKYIHRPYIRIHKYDRRKYTMLRWDRDGGILTKCPPLARSMASVNWVGASSPKIEG